MHIPSSLRRARPDFLPTMLAIGGDEGRLSVGVGYVDEVDSKCSGSRTDAVCGGPDGVYDARRLILLSRKREMAQRGLAGRDVYVKMYPLVSFDQYKKEAHSVLGRK